MQELDQLFLGPVGAASARSVLLPAARPRSLAILEAHPRLYPLDLGFFIFLLVP